MIKLNSKLTVVLTTHILASAPSTKVIQGTINSIKKNFKQINDCNFIIYCDSKINNPNYIKYLSNLHEMDGVLVLDRPHDGFPYSGLQKNYIESIVSSTTPYVLCCEHDWFFLREIDTPRLIQTMEENNFINFVRFNKRDNARAHINNPEPGDIDFWETHVEPESKKIRQPLMKTDCIATHPHIIRRDKFINDWIEIASDTTKRIAGGMVEYNLYTQYTKDILSLGFTRAQEKWGVYNYGSKDDLKIISHTDGNK